MRLPTVVDKLSQEDFDKLSQEEQKQYDQARADQETAEQSGVYFSLLTPFYVLYHPVAHIHLSFILYLLVARISI